MKKQNKKAYFQILVFSLIVFYFLLLPIANAQFNIPTLGSIKPTISLTSDPITPLPNSTITISANLSGIVGAGSSNYIWFLNGVRQPEASGLNKNTFKVRVGNIGEIYRINVTVKISNGETLSETLNRTVSDIDLSWTANSQVPITYRAKAMPTQNSFVTISSLPFIYRPGTKNIIGSGNLLYNWIIEDKFDSGKSGINKSSYTFRVDNFFETKNVRLEIKTQDGTVSLAKEIIIPTVRPQILLYFSDSKTNRPLGYAIKNLQASTKNFNFAAEPYFFTTPRKNLYWQWLINNAEVKGGGETPWLATLNLADNFLGQLSAQIKVTAKNPDNELESSESTINLEIR